MRANRLNLLLAIVVTMIVSGCNGSQPKTVQRGEGNETAITSSNDTETRDYYGTYEETLSRADCNGIKTILKINGDI